MLPGATVQADTYLVFTPALLATRGLLPVANVILLVSVLVNESHCSNLHESKIIIFLLS